MRRQPSILATWLCLPAALIALSCSNSEGEQPAESTAAGEGLAEQRTEEAPTTQAAVAPTRDDLLRDYEAQCSTEDESSLDCEWLRSLVVAEVVEELEAIERSRDQRGVELAMTALGVLDEPEILIASGRILGEFVDTPGLGEKVMPLLGSPYLEVQRIASDLLGRVPNSVLNSLSYEWSANHGGAPHLGPYDEIDLPEHYAGMAFPEYPGAERYGLADSDRSIGWSSPDPAATVASRLGQAIGAEVTTAQQWSERVTQQAMNAAQSMFDPAKMQEIQKLMEEYMKTQDQALIQRVEKLNQEMTAKAEAVAPEKGVEYVATPSGSAVYDQVFYLIAEEKAGRVARLILVYRQPVVERTVIQMAWDLRDYPSAWGEAL